MEVFGAVQEQAIDNEELALGNEARASSSNVVATGGIGYIAANDESAPGTS